MLCANCALIVDMVINVATSIDPNVVANLIAALGKRRKQSGKPVYFLHVRLSSPLTLMRLSMVLTYSLDDGPIRL